MSIDVKKWHLQRRLLASALERVSLCSLSYFLHDALASLYHGFEHDETMACQGL